jgi:5-methylcytosine-specific restriction endonuclease McrA
MGRLTNLKPTLQVLPRTIGFARDADGHSAKAEPWRAWYKTARWKRLRLLIFARDLYQCQREGCGRIEFDTSLLVADHKRRHLGNATLFWDEDNLQTLCKPCHDGPKQRQERRDPLHLD